MGTKKPLEGMSMNTLCSVKIIGEPLKRILKCKCPAYFNRGPVGGCRY